MHGDVQMLTWKPGVLERGHPPEEDAARAVRFTAARASGHAERLLGLAVDVGQGDDHVVRPDEAAHGGKKNVRLRAW